MARWIYALILSALLGAPGAIQAPSEWKTFSSAAGRFSVSVPGMPREEAVVKTPGESSPPTHSFVLPYKDAAYILTYTDLPSGAPATRNSATILDAARDGGIKNVKGTLVSEQQITVNGYAGRDIVAAVPVEDKQGVAQFRLVLAKSRLYMALYVGPEGSTPPAQVERFLKSFQVLDEEVQDGWTTFRPTDGRFTIRMPGTPTEQVSDLEGGGKIHEFALDKGDYAYIVSYNSIGVGVPKAGAVPGLLNKGRDAFISSVHAKLVEERSISLAGIPGKAVRVSIPAQQGTALLRAYIAGDQYYQVLVIAKNKVLASTNADRYFASFQLGAAPTALAWAKFSPKDGRFSIDIPGDPKLEKLSDNTTKYTAQAGNTVYIVVYVDVASAITDSDKIQQVLRASKDAELKVLDSKQVSEKPLKLGEATGLQVVFLIPAAKIPGGGLGIERFYLLGNRLYEVGVLTADTRTPETAYAQFFDSLKLDAQ